ncbi:hypothetical protein, partial [Marinicauda algicola]|uniref:hypothetical protein n=1 Tax=Marinicauda algicola TaxID=2029849 RepID=UPI001A7E9B3D
EDFDFGGFITDWRTGKVIGATWFEERRQTEWFDPDYAALQDQLEDLFADSDITITSWDRAGERLIVNVAGGATSDDFYLLDRTTGEMAFLKSAYPEVPPER